MKFKQTPIPQNLFVHNRKRLAQHLDEQSLVILFSSDEMPRNGDQFYPFRQNSDLFYLTGIEQEKTVFMMFPDAPDKKKREVLFIIEPNELLETWEGHKLTPGEATEISGIETIKFINHYDDILGELMVQNKHVYLNTNENIKFNSEVDTRQCREGRKIKQRFPFHNYQRLAPILKSLRLEKQEEEVNAIRKASDITGNAFRNILKTVKPGVYEYEVEAKVTHEFGKNLATHAYAPIVASGKNAISLHYTDNNDQCHDGELLLFDFGAEYANYASDMSRTIPVNGKFTPRQRECYEAVLRVFKKARQMMVRGTTIESFHRKVANLLEEEHKKLGLYTGKDVENQDPKKPIWFKYYPHGTSHFIGLDVHDVGTKQEVFREGMVLSCEPGLYIPEENIGIRIENDILITVDGPVDLMENIPIEADEIEQLMAG
ncbi:MAG: aminopeptidase P N-terminal domain-containing protein [Bacteroidales bacterium]|nr:aminopeptidase P N-terminal domain-containing protein [Bacteroidales bacterium]